MIVDVCDVKLRFCKPCETKPLAEQIPKSELVPHPWSGAVREGRRRDKDNWSYTLSGEPALFADRGFTGTRSVSSGFGRVSKKIRSLISYGFIFNFRYYKLYSTPNL